MHAKIFKNSPLVNQKFRFTKGLFIIILSLKIDILYKLTIFKLTRLQFIVIIWNSY